LKIHDNLFKIKNILITQMHTNRIELTKYLFYCRVFIIVISACFCDWFRQSLKHVIIFYFNHNRMRKNMLFVVETQILRRLLNINKKVKMMTKLINKDKYIRIIFVNDRMSRMISLSYVNKTNEHRINK
jgi:hypothetical protein